MADSKSERWEKVWMKLQERGISRMKDYFTVVELAEHFGVNPKTIYRRL